MVLYPIFTNITNSYSKLKLAQDIVNNMQFERVHRMGVNSGNNDKPRNIVAKFTLFKDREIVRRARHELKGTKFYINEQFPKEIAAKRKSLQPKLREAVCNGKSAWLSYDTLFINGRPVSDTSN